VTEKLWKLVRTTSKPVVVNFLKEITNPEIQNVFLTDTLAETGRKACRLLAELNGDEETTISGTGNHELFHNRSLVTLPTRETRKFLRVCSAGGRSVTRRRTFCTNTWTALPGAILP